METKEFLESLGNKCRACLEKIDARLDEIAKINETSKDEVELKAVADELAELQAEKAEAVAELKEIEAQIEALEPKKEEPKEEPKEKEPQKEEVVVEDGVKVNPERKNFLVFDSRNGGKTMTIEERKAQAEAFKNTGKKSISTEEIRATLLSGGKIATPTEVHGIEGTFNRVSSIVDLVRVVNCEGMGANKVAYEVSLSEANTYTEGQAIGSSDPQYDFVTITPTAIGVLSLLSNQVMKQTPLDYEGKIVDSAEKALRIKVASFITAKILASALVTGNEANLSITAIDDKTLRKIALAYGSPEAVYGDAWLFLTKKDLIAFGDVRGTNGNKSAVYEITPDTGNPNTGVIRDGGLSVRYCLNPNLTPLADADAEDVVMFYGQPECAELDLFGDYQVKVSEDWAFDKNMLAIRGTAEIGADVIKKDGFVAVSKGS